MHWNIVSTLSTEFLKQVSKYVLFWTACRLDLTRHLRKIVKERQLEFDIDTDPDTMYELFGEDYVSFAE